MVKWSYDLKDQGLKLRNSIHEGEASREACEEILDRIIGCCQYLKEQLTVGDFNDYEYDIDQLIEECEDTKFYLDEYDEDSNADNIDEVLDRFYDLMDIMRVWVGL